MVFALALAGVLTLAPPSGVREVAGSVSYRERMALPPTAELVVGVDRYRSSGQTGFSELRMKLDGRQVPIRFAMSYPADASRYGVRARILDGKRVVFESPRATMLAGGERNLQLEIVRAAASPADLGGKTWELVSLFGDPVTDTVKPRITFRPGDGTFAAFGGVNRFSGRFRWDAPHIQIDPGPSTLMAGPTELMDLEAGYTKALFAANRAAFVDGELVLTRGSVPSARFRVYSPGG